MKAKLRGQITEIHRDSKSVILRLNLNGQVQDVKMPPAKECEFSGDFTLKPVIADNMKIGSTITVTISDEEE